MVGQFYFGDLAERWVRIKSALTVAGYGPTLLFRLQHNDKDCIRSAQTVAEAGYLVSYHINNHRRPFQTGALQLPLCEGRAM